LRSAMHTWLASTSLLATWPPAWWNHPALNELGYPARWEAHGRCPHLILERHPFEELSEHAGARELDVYLLEALLGVPVRRIGRGCIYEVGKRQ